MKKRYLSYIKLEGDNTIRFTHNELYFNCVINSSDVNAIEYNNGFIQFHSSNETNKTKIIYATDEDFRELKQVVSQGSSFVGCGENVIFSIENVVGYNVGVKGNYIVVACQHGRYTVRLNSKEDAKEFLAAMNEQSQTKDIDSHLNIDNETLEENIIGE